MNGAVILALVRLRLVRVLRDRMGLVTVTIDGEPWTVVDIGMRMLTPRELLRARGVL